MLSHVRCAAKALGNAMPFSLKTWARNCVICAQISLMANGGAIRLASNSLLEQLVNDGVAIRALNSAKGRRFAQTSP